MVFKINKMKALFIINEAPSGNEKIYNALRTARQLQKDFQDCEIRMYLLADGVFCTLPNKGMPAGVYNISQMMTDFITAGGKVKMCTSCGESRGLKEMKLLESMEWGNLKDLTSWIADSDKILTY
ncbi:MAG: DsrE family protein [Bacteroidetes bacterium]|jgi:uncharacterized protein involved in oxidation of intracellular sulfur|nr:DsrE family protein [Bacteroidota bacterium]